MTTVDYSQTTEDHQSFLVLIKHTGRQLSWKHFSRCWERINQMECVAIPGQKRDMWIRYKKNYSKDSNEWGDFQSHRKALGLISIGKCSNKNEFEDLFEGYKKEKAEYSETLINSRLVVFGINSDGSQLSDEQRRSIEASSPPPISMKIDEKLRDSNSDTTSCDSSSNSINTENNKNSNGQVSVLSEHSDPLRQNAQPAKTVGSSQKNNSSASSVDQAKKQTLQRTSGSIKNKETSEVVFFPSVDNFDSLEESVREFVTSLFFVLEGKRLDRSFERSDRIQLLCAPFEKKDYVGIDQDSKSYKKKCQGRLRKHLADLCLQAGLPGEAMLHYTTALDILKPVNDLLWMGACYEGLCAASVITTYVKTHSNAGAMSLRRNQSFSVKRGIAGQDKQRAGSIMHSGSYANGLQDLPELANKSCLNPDDIIVKYKECLQFYSKYKNAGVIEIEASLKACRVLIIQKKFLQAADFLQNVVYINLHLSDEDRINRYSTLATLYAQIGFQRKASFFRRVAAMQSVAPQNPKQNWHTCHQILVQALSGYRIYLDPKDGALKSGQTNGWPVLQTRILQELIYSTKRMGNLPLAIRYTTLLLYTLLDHLTLTEKREVISGLENFTSQCEGTTQPLALVDSGVIVPHIPLLNIPLVKSFKLIPLHPHLEPRPLTATLTTAEDNVFIFTPLNLGATTEETAITDVDFCWVQGDIAEIQLQVCNPLPDELKIFHMGLMSEGVEIETFPTSPSIAPESGPYLVKIMSRPTSSGDLTVLGYTTKLFGVKSNCRLRDCDTIAQSHFKVKVVPALPQIQLTSSLPTSASFLSFGEEFNVVTSANTVLYSGQCCECVITLQNIGKLPVEMVRVNLESNRDTRDFVGEVFKWNQENIVSQLPLQVSSLLCFNMALHGFGDFLLPSSKELMGISLDSGDRNLTNEGKCMEAILKIEYSGGPGEVDGFCRCCSVAFSIDVLPSVVFHKWEVTTSESSDHCHLLFDVQNVSGHELELQYSSQCVYLKEDQIRRICIEIERCGRQILSNDNQSEDSFSQYLATFVDIRWKIPSLKIGGKVGIDRLTWSEEQRQLLFISPVSWDIKLNGHLYSPLHIGSLEYKVGDFLDLEVELNIKSDTLDGEVSGILSICCCQNCDNGSVNYDTSHKVSTLGSESVVVSQLSADIPITHSCTYLFTCCGFYRFDIKLQVKSDGQKEIKEQVEIQDVQTWRCSSVIEVNIVD